MSRITEAQIGEAALKVAATKPNGEASIADLKKEIPDHVNLSAEDQVQSVTRPNEEMWEQQIRNLVSHRNAEGNIIQEGYAEYIDGGIRITDVGRKRVS